MTNEIMDSADIADIEELNADDDFSDLTATKDADPETMDFHVQMRGYTMRDFELMVVHAAAQQLVGGRNFKSEISEKANEIASAKVSKELEAALKDVMSITVAKRGKDDVTLSQMIGMEAKDYLTELVGSDGNPTSGGWGSKGVPRVQYLAGKYLRDHFKTQIEAAMKDLRDQIKSEITAQLDATIDAERKKISDALGYEIGKRR